MTLPKSTAQKAILPKPPLVKMVLQKSALPKAMSRPRPELSRIAEALVTTAAVVGRWIARWAATIGQWLRLAARWSADALGRLGRLTVELMRKRPPRFETTIAVGTFAFVVVAVVAGVLMLGDAHL
jgi:hypothetical protein